MLEFNLRSQSFILLLIFVVLQFLQFLSSFHLLLQLLLPAKFLLLLKLVFSFLHLKFLLSSLFLLLQLLLHLILLGLLFLLQFFQHLAIFPEFLFDLALGHGVKGFQVFQRIGLIYKAKTSEGAFILRFGFLGKSGDWALAQSIKVGLAHCSNLSLIFINFSWEDCPVDSV